MAKEYIEREALIARYDAEHVGPPGRARELMATAPAADVAVVRRGRWTIAEDDYYGLNIVKCSVCHEEWYFEEGDDVFDLNYHYCPNCGAYMMGENNGKCE